MDIIVVTREPAIYEFLSVFVRPHLAVALRHLSTAYKFKLPSHLYLLKYPVLHKECAQCYNRCAPKLKKVKCCYGRAGTGRRYDLYVSLNIPACIRNGVLLSVIVHEAAHIAEKLTAGRLSHSKDFEKMEARLLEFMKTRYLKE